MMSCDMGVTKWYSQHFASVILEFKLAARENPEVVGHMTGKILEILLVLAS